jgi:hypothetical protein
LLDDKTTGAEPPCTPASNASFRHGKREKSGRAKSSRPTSSRFNCFYSFFVWDVYTSYSSHKSLKINLSIK